MTTHVTTDQVRWWLDDTAIQSVTAEDEEETEFNLQVTLSRLPIHLIKEHEQGPIRVVGRSAFDTERSRGLLADDEARGQLLDRIGPILATTPGFYTFLDENDDACEFRDADRIQMEHRLYPEETTQQALMDSVMAIASGMRYIQNVVSATRPDPPDEERGSDGTAE
ncbi:hypothetical protein [Haloarcula amylovorans]|uniref:hypothetical protein n=1 Tax=Haloarcula amylovorans TaxID=2562280 RepID=UPI0010765A6C|nr:hypothetical protein [Halomicroarcula amylolytica]